MKKSIIFALCAGLLTLLPCCEAKSVTVTKITDSKAKQSYNDQIASYAKQLEEYAELIKQGEKIQRQIEQMDQMLSHFDFKNISQTLDFFNEGMTSLEKIEKSAAGMAITIGELEDDWTELHTDYNAEDMTPEKREELAKKREERLARNAELSAKILSAVQDSKRERKQMELLRDNIAMMDGPNPSAIKALQAVSQIMTQQMEQSKRTQKMVADKIRNDIVEKEMARDKLKADEARLEREASAEAEVSEYLSKPSNGHTFSSFVPSREELEESMK